MKRRAHGSLTIPSVSSNFAEVRFIDRDKIIGELRDAVRQAKVRYPEIAKVYLIGSLAEGNWTADSDADLIVVVRGKAPDFLGRARYHIISASIPVDSLVYTEAEFQELAQNRANPVAQSLAKALEL